MFSISSPIIAKSKFIQIALKIFSIHPMMGSSDPCFKITRYSMNPWKYFSSIFSSSLNIRIMYIPMSFQPQVTIPSISVDLAAFGNISANEGVKRILGNIRNYPQTNSAGVVAPAFNGDYYRNFIFRTTPAFAFARAAYIGIINFYCSGKRFSHWIYHGFTQPPAQIQCCSIRTNPQLTLKLQSRYARCQCAHYISCPEPVTNRNMAVLNDTTCCYPYVLFTTATTKPAYSNSPCALVSTPGTNKSFGPTHCNQIINARFLCGKFALKFSKRARELRIALYSAFCSHFQCILSYLVPSSA